MGRAGKARKRRLQETWAEEPAPASTGCSGSCSTEDGPVSGAWLAALHCLASNLELYSSPPLRGVRAALYPHIADSVRSGSHWESVAPRAPLDAAEEALVANPAALAELVRVAGELSQAADAEAGEAAAAARAAQRKAFMRALSPLVLEQYRKEGRTPPQGSASARVSNAFRSRDWPLVLSLLDGMAARGESARLGAMQRWVRDCDLAAKGDCGGEDGGRIDGGDASWASRDGGRGWRGRGGRWSGGQWRGSSSGGGVERRGRQRRRDQQQL